MLSALRREVNACLLEIPALRKPALRRSDEPDALLATDLPLCAEESAVADFTARMEAQGWTVRPHRRWLLLDAPVPVPDAPVPALAPAEALCCLSLLQRHPGGEAPRDGVRLIVKAAEAGPDPFERLCQRLHRDFARALRLHQPLPGGLLPYLCRAIDSLHAKEEDA